MALLMLVALVALVAGVLAIVQIVRLPEPEARVSTKTPGSLTLVQRNAGRRDLVLNEEAMLLDPTPLFLPTPYNFTQTGTAGIMAHDASEVFKSYPERPTFSAGSYGIVFPDTLKMPERPVDALTYGQTQTPFALFGRGDRKETPLPARMGVAEVIDTKNRRTLFTKILAQPTAVEIGKTAVPAAVASGQLWQPLEYVVVIAADGAVGEPTQVPTQVGAQVGGSESAAVSRFFEEYLVKNVHIDAHTGLRPGYYILRVGP